MSTPIQTAERRAGDGFFILMANERTGSTATMRLLSGHPEICGSPYDARLFSEAFSWQGLLPENLLRKFRFDVSELYDTLDEAVLLAFIRFLAGQSGVATPDARLWGMKSTFFDSSVPMLRRMIAILRRSNVKVIHLTRDYGESYVSWLINKKTGRGRDRTEAERAETYNTRVRVRPQHQQEYIERARARDEMIRSLDGACPYLHVDYSVLYADVEAGARELFTYLGVSTAPHAITPALRKLGTVTKRLTMPIEHYLEE